MSRASAFKRPLPTTADVMPYCHRCDRAMPESEDDRGLFYKCPTCGNEWPAQKVNLRGASDE